MVESKNKSFIIPVRFWQTSSSVQKDVIENGHPSSYKIKKNDMMVVLKESCKTEVYKLSTIDNSGLYIPPSPTIEYKRDNWIEINEDIMGFHLPSSECLTTINGEKHDFFTPSNIVHSQPYILPIILSDSTSSLESSSCKSSTIIT